MSSPTSSNNTEIIEKIDEITEYSSKQSEERFDLPVFVREDEDDDRVMVERPAGSNHWYQYYYIRESKNEIELFSPATRKTPKQVEWINKSSSRLSRIGLATRLWTFIKKSDGAWVPKGLEHLIPSLVNARDKAAIAKSKASRPNANRKRKTRQGRVGDEGDERDTTDTATLKKRQNQDNAESIYSQISSEDGGDDVGSRSKSDDRDSSDGEDKECNSASSTSSDDIHTQDFTQRNPSMLALANWFKLHEALLSNYTLRLQGSAESAGLRHYSSKVDGVVKREDETNTQAIAGGGGGHATSSVDACNTKGGQNHLNNTKVTQSVSTPATTTTVTTNANNNANKNNAEHSTKQRKSYVVLQSYNTLMEDDLFGALKSKLPSPSYQGGPRHGFMNKQPSTNLSPMNSLTPGSGGGGAGVEPLNQSRGSQLAHNNVAKTAPKMPSRLGMIGKEGHSNYVIPKKNHGDNNFFNTSNKISNA